MYSYTILIKFGFKSVYTTNGHTFICCMYKNTIELCFYIMISLNFCGIDTRNTCLGTLNPQLELSTGHCHYIIKHLVNFWPHFLPAVIPLVTLLIIHPHNTLFLLPPTIHRIIKTDHFHRHSDSRAPDHSSAKFPVLYYCASTC